MALQAAEEASLPFRVADGCVIVRVRLTPKSSLDAVGGITLTVDGPAIAMRVRAVAANGEANAAVIRLLAGWAGVAPSTVRLAGGSRGRVKSLTINGDAVCVADRIAEKLKPSPE